MEQEGQKHQRRVRYKGTHPKRYEEKYKELQPEKYPETVAKVIQKGSTPVGMHIPIMVNEILEFLQIQPGQTGLDATLGYGGHTSRMLERLESKGHIYALDVDSIEMEKTRQRLEHMGYGPEILTIRKLNFANIDQIAGEFGPLDFVLADLGVSSMQIDNPSRGFSFKKEGPLDLRLDPLKGEPASERLKGLTQEELTGMLMENSDEPYAEEIARTVMGEIKRGREVATTTRPVSYTHLAAIMGAVVGAVSPAVIVPKMLKLIEDGYGTDKGIPQLLLAGASVDDVFVIVMFTAFTGLAQGGSVSPISFVKIPVSILIGSFIGLAAGWGLAVYRCV